MFAIAVGLASVAAESMLLCFCPLCFFECLQLLYTSKFNGQVSCASVLHCIACALYVYKIIKTAAPLTDARKITIRRSLLSGNTYEFLHVRRSCSNISWFRAFEHTQTKYWIKLFILFLQRMTTTMEPQHMSSSLQAFLTPKHPAKSSFQPRKRMEIMQIQPWNGLSSAPLNTTSTYLKNWKERQMRY